MDEGKSMDGQSKSYEWIEDKLWLDGGKVMNRGKAMEREQNW